MSNSTEINRWRLILGKNSEHNLSFSDSSFLEMENTLDYLYGRTEDESSREGGLSESNLTVVDWITKVRKLFPKDTIEKIERHALEKYELTELLSDKEVLEKLEPNPQLLKKILQLKHLLNKEVLVVAKGIVKQVSDEIIKKLEQEVKRSTLGKVQKNTNSNVRIYRNFDIKRTILKNLKNYDNNRKKLVLDRVYFNSNIKRHNQYSVIIAVDESGSMLDSVIYSSIMAGIFAKLPMLSTKLVIFDTQVVDLSNQLQDPVETLMSIQLGGGTDIARAMMYCSTLVETPNKTILVLVSDLYEGGSVANLYSTTKDLIESGVKVIALTALDDECSPVFDRTIAKKMTSFGAHVGAMTPNKLSNFIGEIIS